MKDRQDRERKTTRQTAEVINCKNATIIAIMETQKLEMNYANQNDIEYII